MQQFEHYQGCTFLDLIEDERFRSWVFNPSEELDTFWMEIQSKYPALHIEIIEARQFLEQTHKAFDEDNLTQQEVHKRYLHFDAMRRSRKREKSATVRRYYKLIAAASVIALAMLVWLIVDFSNPIHTYATNYGEWQSIVLPDGSKVRLNANSTLRTFKNWDENHIRQVWLDGEAFFEVEEKKQRTVKFQVITDDLTVEVLGTHFNVENRGSQTKVFLQEGSVRIDMGEEERLMVPGDYVTYHAKAKVLTQERVGEAEELVSWKEGVLMMRDVAVGDVLEKVETIYGIEFLLDNKSVQHQALTVAIPMESLEVVIPILEKALEVDAVQEGSRVILRASENYSE